jgi:hypothetical protein
MYLLPGPLVGAALVALSIVGNSGPGFFLLSLAALAAFGIFAPLLQMALRRNRFFEHRPGVACSASLAAVLLAVLAIGTLSVFNQW